MGLQGILRAQAEKRRVCPHSTSHERNCCPGAKLIYFGSVPRSDSFLGFHLGMIFLMPDNAGVLWFMEKRNCFHLRASFSIGQTSRGRCETRREGWSFSGGSAGKEPAAQAGGPELGPSEPTSKLGLQPPLWVGWQLRVLQLCWPV